MLAGDVHIYYHDLNRSSGEIESLIPLLSEDELERANRYYFERDRNRFIVARAGLRRLLAKYLDLKPENIEIEYGDRGKPRVRGKISFNVSHSGDRALYGITLERSIGVDIERLRDMPDLDNLARRFFEGSEYGLIIEAEDKARAFFQIWTAKEAYLKAVGTGIGVGLKAVRVALDPLNLTNIEGKWRIWTREHEDYLSTVVIEGEDNTIRVFDAIE